MPEPRFDIIAVGELNADLLLSGDVTPIFGQVEKLIADASLVMGGSTPIFACGAARLGLRVAFIGKVGDDVTGRFVLGELRARGVDVSGVVVDPAVKTGLTIVFNRPSAGSIDRAMLTYPGSIGALRFDDVDPALVAAGRHLHVGAYFLLEQLRADVPRLFELAHSLGLTTSLDTNYDPREAWGAGVRDAIAQADVFLPNEAELRAIAGEADVASAAARLTGAGRIVAAKLGAQGGFAMRGGQVATAPALPVSVVDTVGAGDTFDAGFVYGYLAGWGLERALRMGCICGSLSTRSGGGTAAQPGLDEALAHLAALEKREPG